MRHLVGLLAVLLLFVPSSSAAHLTAGLDDLYMRFVDVGGGLCVITKMPGGRHFLHGAGHWENTHCAQAMKAIGRAHGDIDLLTMEDAYRKAPTGC